MLHLWSTRQYEEKQLKGQQAREEKRLEFTNLQQRLQNQLEFERQKNPAGMYNNLGMLLQRTWLWGRNLDIAASVRKYARTIATDEKSIAELKREEKDKEKVHAQISIRPRVLDMQMCATLQPLNSYSQLVL